MKKNSNSRTTNTILNSFAGTISYTFVMISTLATRIAFARFLGIELLGLNSLYTSVIQILQISELGISNAIIVFLYGPIKNEEKEKVKSLIQLYKKIYLVFSAILFVLGVLVDFLIIPHIVHVDTVDMVSVQIYFALFLIGVVCSYLFAHNKSIIYAEQKNGFISWVNAIQKIIVGILQILAVFLLRNYYIYLILIIAGNIIENLVCHFWVLYNHPYLRENDAKQLGKEEKKKIVNLIKPVFIVKIADKVMNQSDSIIINSIIDIVTLGMYSNYHTIFNAILGLFSPIGASLTSSYGNLAVGASPIEKYNGYKKSYDLLHLVCVVFCAFFLAYIQDFIRIAYGDGYLLNESLYIWMTVYLYVTIVKTIYYSYQNAMGLHRLDQKQMILQIPVNIISSILFAKIMGINGVVIGSIFAIVTCSLCFKGMFLYKISFHKSISKYYFKTLKDAGLSFIVFAITYGLSRRFSFYSVSGLLMKTILLSLAICIYTIGIFMSSKDFRISFRFIVGKFTERLKRYPPQL